MKITANQRWRSRLLGVAIISAFPAAIAFTVVAGTALVDRYQAIGTAATCSGESQQQQPAWARGGPLLLLGPDQWSTNRERRNSSITGRTAGMAEMTNRSPGAASVSDARISSSGSRTAVMECSSTPLSTRSWDVIDSMVVTGSGPA